MQYFKSKAPFCTESGAVLLELDFAYCTYGTLNAAADNVIWINHALTGDANAADWWSGLIGEGRIFNPERFFIVCANNLGSCYGATNPRSLNPATREAYAADFPVITTGDQARYLDILRAHLQIEQIHLLIGGSMGGQIAAEWAVEKADLFRNLCLLATNARHSAWGIAFNTAQRMAIEADPTLFNSDPEAGRKGLAAARAAAMLSYRTYDTYDLTQTDVDDNKIDAYRADSYQRYQGQKLWERFDPLSYICLSKAMDTHNLGRGNTSVEGALRKITARTLVIGISSDILFPPHEQEFLARYIPDAELNIIRSIYGHDGFLIEFARIGACLVTFLAGDDLSPHIERLHALPGSEVF